MAKSQNGAATDLGVTSRTIERWEADHTRPHISSLSNLAEYYDVPLGKLVKLWQGAGGEDGRGRHADPRRQQG